MAPMAMQPLAVPVHPPSTVARSDPAYRWLAADLVSGLVITELPIQPTSLQTTMGAYGQATLSMPIPDAPDVWPSSTVPGRSLLVCQRDDGELVWGGYVLKRQGGSDPLLQLSCVTVEGYFDRRYVHDRSFNNIDQAQIVAQLVALDAAPNGIGLVVDAPDEGTLRQRDYATTDDVTVYQRLTELMGVIGGPEWTVRLTIAAGKVTKTLLVRERLGVDNTEAVFSMPGSVESYSLTEDYSSGAGANRLLATGDTGDDETRAVSAPHIDTGLLAAGWPEYDMRINYSSVTSAKVLNSHATEDLARFRLGTQSLTMTGRASDAPRYGTDWRLGDTVRVKVDSSYRHPDGFDKRIRAIGVELDIAPGGSVSPVLDWED